jgi:murein DD-endopeptidase MepM/ murein hydrolase activator NlpD
MTQSLVKGAVLGVIGGGLVACVSAPAYPITQSAAPAPAPMTTAAAQSQPEEAPPPAIAPQPAPQGVQSQPLTPIPAAPAASPPPAAEYTPPPPAAASPPPMAERAPPSRRPAGRYVAAGKVIEPHQMYRDYAVARGDHLDAIARDLQTTREILVETNHIKHPDSLTPGQHLKVPIEKAYVVESGDTLAAVARRFDVSVDDLADLNGLPVHARLRSGDQIALPGVYHDKGPVLEAELPPPPTARSRYAYSGGGYRPSPWAVAASQNAGVGTEGLRAQPYPTTPAPEAPSLTDDQVMAAGRGRFVWPVRGEVLSAFGIKDVGRRNDGVDVKAALGTPVRAAAAGDVVYAGDQVPGFGNLVLVKHSDGWVTAYAHLDKVTVRMRDNVSQDQEIGEVGETGGVSEPQLHFEIRYAPSPTEKAKPIDPLLVLPK